MKLVKVFLRRESSLLLPNLTKTGDSVLLRARMEPNVKTLILESSATKNLDRFAPSARDKQIMRTFTKLPSASLL